MELKPSYNPNYEFSLIFSKEELPTVHAASLEVAALRKHRNEDPHYLDHSWQQLQGTINVLNGNLVHMEETATMFHGFAVQTEEAVEALSVLHAPFQDVHELASLRRCHGETARRIAELLRKEMSEKAVLDGDKLAGKISAYFLTQPIE